MGVFVSLYRDAFLTYQFINGRNAQQMVTGPSNHTICTTGHRDEYVQIHVRLGRPALAVEYR